MIYAQVKIGSKYYRNRILFLHLMIYYIITSIFTGIDMHVQGWSRERDYQNVRAVIIRNEACGGEVTAGYDHGQMKEILQSSLTGSQAEQLSSKFMRSCTRADGDSVQRTDFRVFLYPSLASLLQKPPQMLFRPLGSCPP